MRREKASPLPSGRSGLELRRASDACVDNLIMCEAVRERVRQRLRSCFRLRFVDLLFHPTLSHSPSLEHFAFGLLFIYLVLLYI